MYYTLIKALLYIALVAVFMFLFYWIYILYNTYKQEDRIPPIVLEIEDVIRNIGKRVFDNIITPSVKAIFRFFKWLFSESTRNKILGFFKCLLLGILELFKLLFSIIFGWLFSDSTPNNEGTAASQQKKAKVNITYQQQQTLNEAAKIYRDEFFDIAFDALCNCANQINCVKPGNRSAIAFPGGITRFGESGVIEYCCRAELQPGFDWPYSGASAAITAEFNAAAIAHGINERFEKVYFERYPHGGRYVTVVARPCI